MPTITQFIQSVSNPKGLFRTLGEPSVVLDGYRRPAFCCGRNAVVFRVTIDGSEWMLKCFFDSPHARRVAAVYEYAFARAAETPLLVPVRYLENEVYIYDHLGNGSWHDAAIAPWVEGRTLDYEVRLAATENNSARLRALAKAFDHLACELLAAPWAHGDLKPENIIVTTEGKMRLVDYDAMFIPALTGECTVEIGTAPWQHPARDGFMYDKHIDDYPLAMIAVSLHALALDPGLYASHNRCENLILTPSEILSGTSPLHDELLRRWAAEGRHRPWLLAHMLRSPSPALPYLDEAFAERVPVIVGGESLEPAYRSGLWGYVDPVGRWVIPARYRIAFRFSESLAAVNLGGCWHLIDAAGRIVLNCADYEQIKPVHEGFVAVKTAAGWGYITTAGGIAIEPAYDEAYSFRNGCTRVRSGNEEFFIDSTGKKRSV